MKGNTTKLVDVAKSILEPRYQRIQRELVEHIRELFVQRARALGAAIEVVRLETRQLPSVEALDFNGSGFTVVINDRYWAVALSKQAKSCYLLTSDQDIRLEEGPMLRSADAKCLGANHLSNTCTWKFHKSFRYDARLVETFTSVDGAANHAVKLSPKRV